MYLTYMQTMIHQFGVLGVQDVGHTEDIFVRNIVYFQYYINNKNIRTVISDHDPILLSIHASKDILWK